VREKKQTAPTRCGEPKQSSHSPRDPRCTVQIRTGDLDRALILRSEPMMSSHPAVFRTTRNYPQATRRSTQSAHQHRTRSPQRRSVQVAGRTHTSVSASNYLVDSNRKVKPSWPQRGNRFLVPPDVNPTRPISQLRQFRLSPGISKPLAMKRPCPTRVMNKTLSRVGPSLDKLASSPAK